MDHLNLFFGGLVLLGLAIYIAMKSTQRRIARQGAKKIIEQLRKAYVPRHEYATAWPAQFPWLDHAWYDGAQAALEEVGFRFLGNMVDLTVNQTFPERRTYIRIMATTDGQAQAGIFQIKTVDALSFPRVDVRSIDMTSETAYGTFICTSNAPANLTLDKPPQLRAEYLPTGAPPGEVLRRHRERLAEFVGPDGAELTPISTLEDALALQQRIIALQAAFRASRGGGVTEEEMRRIAGDRFQSQGRLLMEEMNKLLGKGR